MDKLWYLHSGVLFADKKEWTTASVDLNPFLPFPPLLSLFSFSFLPSLYLRWRGFKIFNPSFQPFPAYVLLEVYGNIPIGPTWTAARAKDSHTMKSATTNHAPPSARL